MEALKQFDYLEIHQAMAAASIMAGASTAVADCSLELEAENKIPTRLSLRPDFCRTEVGRTFPEETAWDLGKIKDFINIEIKMAKICLVPTPRKLNNS